MPREEFTAVFNPSIVLLSVGIAFIGAYITICLCEQLRLKRLPNPLPTAILGEKGMIVAMAVSLGGIAIWSMHFVGMSSMHLRAHEHHTVIRYSVWKTIVSLIAVVLMAMLGLYISSFDVMFGKSKQEIIEIYVNHASKMKMSEIKKISVLKMIWIISTHSLGYLVCGGVIAGSGVSVMHYLGMLAMEFDEGRIEWDAGIVAASILIAIIASTAAFWILYRLLSLYSNWESLRVLSAAVMTVAVCGMHYTGMVAATFVHDSNVSASKDAKANSVSTFVGAENAALILSFVLLIVIIVEVRTQHHALCVEKHKVFSEAGSRVGSQFAMSKESRVSHTGPSSVASRVPEKTASHSKTLLQISKVAPQPKDATNVNNNDSNDVNV